MKASKVGRGGSTTSPMSTTTTGPGTGSMKGTCSICGDRATKVPSKLIFLQNDATYCCSFDTASTPQPPVSPVEHSSGDLWQLESTPVSHAGFQRDFELENSGDIYISTRMVASCTITKANRKKCQACRCHLVTCCRDE